LKNAFLKESTTGGMPVMDLDGNQWYFLSGSRPEAGNALRRDRHFHLQYGSSVFL